MSSATDTIRVLIADDSQMDVELVLLGLERGGIVASADVVDTPEEFSARLKSGTYDIVLSDYRMPGWTGLDALRLVKEAGLDTPLIMITGTLGDENAVDCVKLGVADYVLKQNLSRLPLAVRRALKDAHEAAERKATVEHLRESEERHRTLTEASFDGIAISVDGVIVEANRGYAEMFGYTVDEVIGRMATDFVTAESEHEVHVRTVTGIEGTYELIGKRKDGSRIALEATGRSYPVNGRRGRVAALRDVTEKRSLEKQFQQAQKMEAVGRLAGGVAHDFNNLLTVIMSCAYMTLEDMPPDDPKRHDINCILDAANGAAALTRQLLAFSRQQVIQPRLVVLDSVVANTEKMLTRLIGDDIVLETVLNAGESSTMIDPSQLEQVIMNLVVNARDAMPNGGRITLETLVTHADESMAVSHWPALPGTYARLTVRDTGVGMDAETQSHVFEPFFTTKEVGKGTGLGLSMVYGILKQCGGFIEIESAVDVGTAFHLYLPAAVADEKLEPQAELDALAPLRGTETVLLAEDSATVRAAIVEILERSGYAVIAPATSSDALRVAENHQPHIDILLTDIVMPGLNGRLLAEEFTRLRPGASVLFISGYTDDAVILQGIRAQGLPFVQKPFTPAQLLRKLKDVLGSR
ncbi:MAG: response regulator [bacterium]